MSGGLYGIGVSGLMTAQNQLQTTGHNIANANTDGFSRQRAIQQTNNPFMNGGNWYGQGVNIAEVNRIFDTFAFKEQMFASNRAAYFDARTEQLSQLDSNMSRSGETFKKASESYFNAIHSITDQPSDSSVRRLFLDEAESHAGQLKRMYDAVDQQHKSLNNQIEQAAARLSDYAKDLADINVQIQASGNSISPDLLDKRDTMVSKIAELVSVSTYTHPNGAVSVFIGSGQTLVAETNALKVVSVPGDPDSAETQLKLETNVSSVGVDEMKLGGKLGALFETRDVELKQAKTELDLLAMAQADAMNTQQSQGLDLNGLQGKNLYTDINDLAVAKQRIMPNSTNSGTLDATVQITDVSLLSGHEFRLDFDGANFTLVDLHNNSSQVLAENPVGSGRYAASPDEGFELVLDTPGVFPNAGDSFLVRPTRNGVTNFNVELQQPEGIAASTSVAIRNDPDNISSGTVSISAVADPELARSSYTMPLAIEVIETPANSGIFQARVTDDAGNPVQVFDSGGALLAQPFTYNPPGETFEIRDPGGTVSLFNIDINGSPSGAAPNGWERFFVDDAYGAGNNENALLMAEVQNAKLVKGQYTLDGALSTAISRVGSAASSAETTLATAQTLKEQAITRQQSISGVNLDEEASNMLRYQQAYQASARILETASTIFDTLLQSAR